MFGFYRLAAAVPELRIADVPFNLAEIQKLVKEAENRKVALATFPELALTGYTCADLFHQTQLQSAVEASLLELCRFTRHLKVIVAVGAPILHLGRLYNCAILIQSGKILGAVPKTYLPNYKEFYEKRWFTSGAGVDETISLGEQTFPLSDKLIFRADQHFAIGLEVCEDFWNVIPPSSYQALAGATVFCNLSASNEMVAKAAYRRQLVCGQSARTMGAYVYSSAGVHESTTDVVFGGHALIAENGSLLTENSRFQRRSELITADVDLERMTYTRITESSFADNPIPNFKTILLNKPNRPAILERPFSPTPFVPADHHLRDERCEEIFSIQTAGLAKRLQHAGLKRVVIGISGGLDSTLALMVVRKTFDLLNLDPSGITAVTMPGFGTTGRTYQNAVTLCKEIGSTFREISIKEACVQHFKDIGHDQNVHDVTYENVQARERTQILMDIANQNGGLVIGTGDLSEIALGWSTYNGDHMSMYAVNCSIPKTLIKYLVNWAAEKESGPLKEALLDIIDTPISPELLPPDESGEIAQKTESVVGPYTLHDFFLYHTVKYGASSEKVRFLAMQTFADEYTETELKKWHDQFVRRFFQQQFKRSCIPDGPKVGSISLSPRGDWRMPSDAAATIWR